jgi:hypothetical protein
MNEIPGEQYLEKICKYLGGKVSAVNSPDVLE